MSLCSSHLISQEEMKKKHLFFKLNLFKNRIFVSVASLTQNGCSRSIMKEGFFLSRKDPSRVARGNHGARFSPEQHIVKSGFSLLYRSLLCLVARATRSFPSFIFVFAEQLSK